MLKNIFITVFCCFILFGAFILINSAYQYHQFRHSNDELFSELSDLEKIPLKQRTAETYFKIANLYLNFNYEADEIIATFLQASDLGHSQATYNLAMISSAGIETNLKLPDAKALFEKAAIEGSLSAKFTLRAHKILKTEKITAGYEAIIQNLMKASDAGNIEASYLLCAHGKEAISRIFAVGNLSYCEIAVHDNYPPALYLMGRLYEQNPNEFHPDIWKHNGLDQDIAKAKEYYQKTADLSYAPAIERLKILESGHQLSITKSTDRFAYLPDSIVDYFLKQQNP